MVAELKRAPIMAIKPTGEEVQLLAVVTAPPAETASYSATLPATASGLPLVGLLGLMSLFAAFGLRIAVKRLQ